LVRSSSIINYQFYWWLGGISVWPLSEWGCGATACYG
jgi:hypothetical protein